MGGELTGRRTPIHLVAMGVAGSGKTVVGVHLAAELSLMFIEGDIHHPEVNVAKMASGVPLTDEDRLPWLQTLARIVREQADLRVSTVLTCSALRRRYRDVLREGARGRELFFLHLHGSFDVLLDRMNRREHFMPASLLQSQFDTLEPLEDDELGVLIDVDQPLDAVVAEAAAAVRQRYDR